MKLFWRRSLSLILVLLMVMSVMPATVFAEDTTASEETNTETEAPETTNNPDDSSDATTAVPEESVVPEAQTTPNVAKVGNTEYATIAAAIAAAVEGDTITLAVDVGNVDVTINKNIVLDFGGKTITEAYIQIEANVKIQNGSIKNENEPYPLVVNSGTLTIENVAIEASKSDRAIWLRNSGAVLNFNSGSILATKGANNTYSKIYGIWVCQGATANINGGSITVDAGADATAVAIFGNYTNTVNVTGGKISTSGKTYSYAIWVDGDVTITGGEIVTNEKKYGYSSGITYGKNYAINSKGDVEISGGTITTNGPSGYLVNAGGSNQNVTISNVEFTNVLSEADKTAGGHSAPNLIYGSSVTAEITGGEYTGVNAQLIKGTGSTLEVSGGTFDVEINEEYLAEGVSFTQNEDGTFDAYIPPKGNNFTGYTGSDAIWGEVWGNATESFVIKVLDANGNVMGSTSLNNVGGIIDGDVNVTWNLKLDAASNTDEYWTMAWTTAPTIDNMPAKVELWVDGVKVSGGSVVLNGPDEIAKIYAANVDEDGKILAYSTTVQAAVDVAAENDGTVVLLRNSSESVFVPSNVTINKNGYSYTKIEPVAKIDGVEYATLQDAINAAQAGDVVVLLGDVILTDTLTVPAGSTVILDLNGKTISQTKAQTAGYQMILNDGNLTINDSVGGGKISYTDSGNGGEYISDTIYNRGTLVINGGTIENLSSATVATNGYPHAVDTYSGIRDTSVTINGGTIYCAEYSAIRMFCVSATHKADLVINGGTIKGAIDMQNGTKDAALGSLTINDGKFETTKNANNIRFANWNGGATEYGVTAKIKGGNFNGGITSTYVPAAANWNKKIISGGIFASDAVKDYCANGYTLTELSAGVYGVQASVVASIGEENYSSLQEAIDAANDGDQIILKANTTIATDLVISKNISIVDYSTYTITFMNGVGLRVNNGASVAIAGINFNLSGRWEINNGASLAIQGLPSTDAFTGVTTWSDAVIDITGAVAAGNALFCIGNDGESNVSKLALNHITMVGDGYNSAYGVFYLRDNDELVINNSNITLANEQHGSGGFIKSEADDNGIVKITDTSISLTNAKIGFLNGIVTLDTVDLDIKGGSNAINQTVLTVIDSTITVDGADGRALTLKNGNVTIQNSTLNFSNCSEGEIRFKDALTLNVDSTSTISECDIYSDVSSGAKVNDAEVTGTETNPSIINNATVTNPDWAAKIGGVYYMSLEEAFKAATEGCVIEILADVVVDYKWDCRDYATGGSHSQFKESVTINGNDHTIKFTGAINDNNWNTVFRFEENATVKNLTIDISEATGAQRVITAKKSLTVDGLTVIGSAKYGIIFGEGATATDLAATEIVIKNSTLAGTRRAISDNEGGKDVKSVTIIGNTLNANVCVSAFDNVTFTGNNVTAGYVDIRSYTADNTLDVTATNNTLTANTETKYNYIEAGGTIKVQDDFVRPARGEVAYRGYITDSADREAIQIDLNKVYATTSVVVKLYDANGTLLITTSLKAGAYEGDALTVNMVLSGKTSGSWDTTIHAEKLTVANVPAKAELWIDGSLLDTFEPVLGNATDAAAYQLPAYLALDCVYKEAKLDDTYYASVADAIADITDNCTLTIYKGTYDAALVINKSNVTVIGEGDVTLNGIPSIKGTNYKIENIDFVYTTGSTNLSGSGLIKDCSFTATATDGNAFRYCYGVKDAAITFEGCTLNAPKWAIHFDSAPGLNLTLTNCEINGRVALGGDLGEFNATGTTFENGYVNVWGTVSGATFTECDFVDVPYVFTGYDADNTFKFNDCTVTDDSTTKSVTDIIYGGTDSAEADIFVDDVLKSGAAKIGDIYYATFAEALAAANVMTGDVTIIILDKVTLNSALSGSFDSIKFVGKDTDAEIYLDVQGYITATGKKVAFEDLILSKSAGGFITNAGFMNVAFGIYDVTEVTYTNCTFANGAYASSGNVTYNGCTFQKSHDKYGLWAYGDVNVTVSGCTFDNDRGIKMYAEGAAKTVDLTVENTDFSKLTGKPAIVLTYGESVTLAGTNIYSDTGVFELDLDGAPNGTTVNAPANITCKNDNGACGVLVDGKIYTTVAQAAAVATKGSTVTLLHNTTETVELPLGVTLNLNGYTAGGVTIDEAVAKIGTAEYATLADALKAAQDGDTITLVWAEGDAPIAMNGYVSGKTVTITGTAEVDWENGFLFVGRTNDGTAAADAKLIFKDAKLTTTAGGCHGIHVSGAEKGSSTKANGTVEIINSTINLTYLINKGNMTLDNSTLTVKSGFAIGGRPASETESGEDATATITLNNGSKVVVNNHNGMGLGYEAIGVMNIDATSTFETTQNFLVTAKGTMKVDGGTVKVVGTLTNNGVIEFTNVDLTDITIDGAGTTYFYGDIGFYGTNSVTSGVNGSDFEMVVNKGATLLISRFVLGYNRNITVYGEIEDAHAFDPTGKTPSLKFNSTSGVSVGGYGTGNLTVKDAYIELGSSSWKNATGTYTWSFENSYVSATSFTNNNAQGSASATWIVTFDDSVLTAKNYIKNGVGTTYNFTNGSVATTGSLRIDGVMNIDETSSVITTAQQNNKVGAEDEHGGINGTVNVEGTLTIGSTSKTQLEMLGGELNVTGELSLGNNSLTLDATSEMTSTGDISGAITAADGAIIEISGGTYTQAIPEEWCADGFICEENADGTYGVREETFLIIIVSPVATMSTTTITVATMDEAIAYAQANRADNVTYQIVGPVELTTGFSHGIIDFGGTNVTIEGVTPEAKLTIVGGGVPDIKGVTFKNITLADEGTYLTTANEFMYQNYIDCTFENVTFKDGIRLSGDSTLTNCTVDVNTTNEYAIWLDEGNFTMTGSSVIGGNDAYGLIKSDTVDTITIENNTFQYLGNANKEALNVKGAAIDATGNKFIDCTKGILPTDKTNYAADGTTELKNDDIAANSIVIVYVAKIGNVKYESLAEAIAAAQAGETITLVRDVVLTETLTIPAGKTITLDLNGKTISQEKACTASYEMIANNGTLTITGNGKISFKDTGAGDPNAGWGSYTIRNNGTLVVENGTIEHLGEQNQAGQAFAHTTLAIFQYSGSTTINGGTISTPNYRSIRLWSGDLTINGGTFDGQVWVHCVNDTAKLTINGGSFSPNGNDGSSVFVNNSGKKAELSVAGGTFETKIGADSPTTLEGDLITGGTFTEKAVNGTNTALLAKGYEFDKNEYGTYGVYSYVAKVGDTKYETIDEAIANWTNGKTLTLLADVTLSDVIKLKSTEHHILNLGTYTMTAASGMNAIEITCEGRSGASYALTVNADATNPGGINAPGKACIYYKKTASTKDRPIIVINNGVFDGSYSINSSSSNGGTNCPQYWINGGTFNAYMNLTKAMLITKGGYFNCSINCTGDVSAYRQFSGGTFKNWQFMTAGPSGSEYKLTVGNSKNVFDNGVYVDDNGYLVVGGPVINAPGDKFEASSTNYGGWSSYLQYSSAKENGLYYTDVYAALADNNKTTGEVKVYTDVLDLTSLNYKGTILATGNLTITYAEGTTPAWTVEVADNADGLNHYTETVVDGVVTRTYIVVEDAAAKIGDTYYATVAEAFVAAKNGEEVEILKAGTYSIPTGKSITITGAVDGVVFNCGQNNIGMGGASVTFNNVTFNWAANGWPYHGLAHCGDMVYNDCTFNGTVFLYGTSETFNNCKFNVTGDTYNVWTYSANKATFNGCTFNSDGKALLIYHEGASQFNEVTITDCDFIANSAVTGKAAIEMDSSLTAGISLTIDADTTATGFGTGNVSGNSLWNNKKGNNTDANNDITVIVNNETVLAPVTFVAKIGNVGYTSLADAITAAQAGETVTILAGEYTESLNVNKAITVVGETDDQGNNLVKFNGKLNITADGATVKNLNFNNGSSTAGYISAKDVLVENCTVVGGNGFRYCYTKGTVTFKDSTITGSTYGIHFDGSAGGKIVIDNCVITGWTSFAGTIEKVTIEDTTFDKGNYNQLRFYQDAEMTNVKFNPEMNIDFGKNEVSAEFNNCSVTDGSTSLSSVIYLPDLSNMGIKVTVDNKQVVAVIGEDVYFSFADAIAAVGTGDVVIELVTDATFDYNARDAYGTADTTSLTINGNGNTLTLNQKNSDWASIGLANASATLVLNDMIIEKTGYGDTSGAWNTHAIIFSCNVEMNNVTVNNSVAVQNGATLNNVIINEANEYYGLWINGNGQTVKVNGGSINATTNNGRGIKIADQYIDAPASVTLEVTGTKFSTAKKAAVLVSSKAGADITATNVDITNVAADPVNFVWVDSDWSAHYGEVTVTGATKAQEDVSDFVITIVDNNDVVVGYYKTLAAAIAGATDGDIIKPLVDVVLTESTIVDKNVTVDLNGKTVTVSGISNAPAFRILANVTFKNGTVNAQNGTNSYAFIVGNNEKAGELTIESGSYIGITTVVSVTKGIANIKGGTYSTEHDGEGVNYGTHYMLNLIDNADAKIVVTGGTFLGFNPANNTAEGANTNFVAEGYCSVPGNSAWTVKLGHTEVIDAAVSATCTETGLTEGKHCSVCGEILVAQEVVPVEDHDWVEATLTAPKHCSVCGVTEGEALARPVAQIGLNTYETLGDAILAAKDGDIIQLLCDINMKQTIVGHEKVQKITIDLGGYKISGNDSIFVANRAGTILTLMNGTISGNGTNGTLRATYGGTIVLGDKLIVTSGGQANAIVVKGGNLEIASSSYVQVMGGVDCIKTNEETNKVSIAGGTFSGNMNIHENTECVITGGTFTVDVNEYCPDGYIAVDNGNGTWTVKKHIKITLDNKTMVVNSTLPAFTYTVNDAWTNVSISLNITTDADTATTGEYTITATAAPIDGHYIEIVPGTLTVVEGKIVLVVYDDEGANVVSTTTYETLEEALEYANTIGKIATITLGEDVAYSNMFMGVGEYVTLDLHGFKLTAGKYVVTFAGAHIVDTSAERKGRLVVDSKYVILDPNNKQLPVMIEGEGYRFIDADITQAQLAQTKDENGEWVDVKTDDSFTVHARPKFGKKLDNETVNTDFNMLFTDPSAIKNSGVQVVITLEWTDAEGTIEHEDFIYSADYMAAVYSSSKPYKLFSFSINGVKDYNDIHVYVKVISDTGVVIASNNPVYTHNPSTSEVVSN